MKKAFSFKRILPHLLAAVLFLLITVVYFSPIVLGNKSIRQGDIVNYIGMSKEINDFRAQYQEEPLWTNSMFGGMPAYQISTFYPSNLISYVNKFISLGLPHPIYFVFLSMLSFYILVLVLGIDSWLGILGALAFGLSSYFFIILEAGHNSKAHAIAFMPAVLAGIVLLFRGRLLVGGVLTALFLALEIYANHLQITYYLALLVLVYCVAEFFTAIKQKTVNSYFKAIGVLFIAGLLAMGANFANLWSTYDYGKYTTRGRTELTINPDFTSNKKNITSGLDKDYATAWSYGKSETMTLLIPNYKGGVSAPIGKNEEVLKVVDPQIKDYIAQNGSQYFGDQPFTSGPVYVGAIAVFLFILGLFWVKGTFKWVLLVGTVLSILLSWGHNFSALSDFFLSYIPGYNKFRAVSMILVIAELTIPILAVLVIDTLLKNKTILQERSFGNRISNDKVFYIAFALTGGVALLAYVSPSSFNTFFSEQEFTQLNQQIGQSPKDAESINFYMQNLEKAREAIFKSDAIRSFFLIALAASLVYLYMRKVINNAVLIGSLIVLVAADMLSVDRRYLNKESFTTKQEMNSPFIAQGRPGKADDMIKQDKAPSYRVFSLLRPLDQDAVTSYFHQSIGGYHAAKLKRYQELIDFYLSKSYYGFQALLQSRPTDSLVANFLAQQQVVNMLNGRYVIYNPNAAPIQNPYALGNVWFVTDYKLVDNADSEIVALRNFDPAKTAIIDKRFAKQVSALNLKKDVAGGIKLVTYKPNHLTYQSKSASEQLAVFSEIYYPSGWNAYVDGKKMDYVRANYVLRAMIIPSGEHTIEFRFEPVEYVIGEKVSLVCSSFLILSAIGLLVVKLRKAE